MIHLTIFGCVLFAFGACADATTYGSCDLKTWCLVCSWSQYSFRNPLSFDVESFFELMHTILLQRQMCIINEEHHAHTGFLQSISHCYFTFSCVQNYFIDANNVTEILLKGPLISLVISFLSFFLYWFFVFYHRMMPFLVFLGGVYPITLKVFSNIIDLFRYISIQLDSEAKRTQTKEVNKRVQFSLCPRCQAEFDISKVVYCFLLWLYSY